METATRRDLPCSNPELVDEYVAIARILKGRSTDFERCYICDMSLCDHNLDIKREDESYKVLVQHFREGGSLNEPIVWHPEEKEQSNGHHRLAAALDAGFTHIPVRYRGWGTDNWEGVELEKYGFTMNYWNDGIVKM